MPELVESVPDLFELTTGRSQEARFAVTVLYLVEQAKSTDFASSLLALDSPELLADPEQPSLLGLSTSLLKKSLETVKKSRLGLKQLEALDFGLFDARRAVTDTNRVVADALASHFDGFLERVFARAEKQARVSEPKSAALGRLDCTDPSPAGTQQRSLGNALFA